MHPGLRPLRHNISSTAKWSEIETCYYIHTLKLTMSVGCLAFISTLISLSEVIGNPSFSFSIFSFFRATIWGRHARSTCARSTRTKSISRDQLLRDQLFTKSTLTRSTLTRPTLTISTSRNPKSGWNRRGHTSLCTFMFVETIIIKVYLPTLTQCLQWIYYGLAVA